MKSRFSIISVCAILLALAWWLFQADETVTVAPVTPVVIGAVPKTQTPSNPASTLVQQPTMPPAPAKDAVSQDLSTPLPQSPQEPVAQKNAIAPIQGVVVDRDGHPVAQCFVIGSPSSRLNEPAFRSNGLPPGTLMVQSDTEGRFILNPSSDSEMYHVGIPPKSPAEAQWLQVSPKDCSQFPQHKSGDSNIRLVLPYARLLVKFDIPLGVPPTDAKDVNLDAPPSMRKPTVGLEYMIQLRLLSGSQQMQVQSRIPNREKMMNLDAPPSVDLVLDIKGSKWKDIQHPFRLEPGEVRQVEIPLEVNNSSSSVRLLNIHNPDVFKSGIIDWADITGHEGRFDDKLDMQRFSLILGELGIRLNQVSVTEAHDPVLQCTQTGLRTLLIIARTHDLLPRILKAEIPDGGMEIEIDARLSRGGRFEVRRRSPDGPTFKLSVSDGGSKAVPWSTLRVATEGREFWSDSVPPNSTATPFACLPSGDYVLHLTSDTETLTREFTITAGETTRIEID
ncbi:MAG: hypothetical protein AB7F75_12135 [Planctomycetota bacterium]